MKRIIGNFPKNEWVKYERFTNRLLLLFRSSICVHSFRTRHFDAFSNKHLRSKATAKNAQLAHVALEPRGLGSRWWGYVYWSDRPKQWFILSKSLTSFSVLQHDTSLWEGSGSSSSLGLEAGFISVEWWPHAWQSSNWQSFLTWLIQLSRT